MIFLKDPNIIFLKPQKVAGTSFEIDLSKFASSSDIITPTTTVKFLNRDLIETFNYALD